MTTGPTPSPAVAGLTAYKVPKHGAPIDLVLSGNEGIAPPAALLNGLAAADPEILRRYPSAAPLEAALAERFDVDPAQVVVTAGGDDALERTFRAFLAPGREVVLSAPTFVMLNKYAVLVGATQVQIPWLGGAFPTEAVAAAVTADTGAICVVSPNNPTGAVATADDLRRLSAAAPHAVLIVDLAYGEMADEDLTAAALALPNAVVFRTFSKAWGLAGARLGYAIGPSALVGWLRAAGNPYAVSGPSVALGL
ncbi:MAG: histidinol-phosphate aminotransferase family protein, partial [Deltaproteobacteria bacterium]